MTLLVTALIYHLITTWSKR